MVSTTIHTLLVLMALSLLTACEQSDQDQQTTKKSAEHAVAEKTGVYTSADNGPPTIDPNLAQQGKALYNQNCIFCHQADAIGKPGTAPSLTNKEFLAIAPVKFLMGTIHDGRPGTGMPPFAHLGDKKIEAIVAFLRSHATLPSQIEAAGTEPHTQGDPEFGRVWFHQICSTCHGPNGDGYSAGGTGTAIGKAGFLNKVTDGFIRETIKKGRSNTRMRGFHGPAAMANLSNKEIDDIIAYMRTIPGNHQ